ncbi:tetratricopeptide repeat protein [Bradyrhizobium elkanii]|uniref:tetratricopeptide repeat protein n=1 Tax=Bradyrhizobium elkanii TaxID=29448 RepID=UPI003518228D
MRRDLDSYYVDSGRDDPVRITIPKGSYVPHFEWHKMHVADTPSREPALELHDHSTTAAATRANWTTKFGIRRYAPVAAALAAGVAAWIWLAARPPPSPMTPREPAVLVMPFEPLTPGENTRLFAIGMGQELTSNLFRFGGFRLYTSPPNALSAKGNEAPQPGRPLGASYVVRGSVQTSVEEVQVTTTVFNAENDEIVWMRTYARPFDPQSLMNVQRELASEIATVVGQSYGVVRNDIRADPPRKMESYLCVLRAQAYRSTFRRVDFDPAMQCLQQTVQRDPQYSDSWAMLGWLHLDAGRLGYSADGNPQTEYDKALEATSRAIALQPNSPLALKALAAAYHFTGRYADSDRISHLAIDLNPNDPDILAQFGWRLAIRGNFSEGVPMLKRAIERTLHPPAWYLHFIAVDLYLKGEYKQMLDVAETASLRDSGFSQLLIAMANTELGRRDATQTALNGMSQYKALADDPAGFLRRNGAADQVVDVLMTGLRKAQALVAS